MTLRFIALASALVLSACGSASRGSAQPSAAARPFTVSEVATFNEPWAMAFVPNRPFAIVTEKPGRLWWIDLSTGRKVAVSGVPPVAYGGQGGLLDVAVAPDYPLHGFIYLTYSEPSPRGGSGLALTRARLIHTDGGTRLDAFERLWHDPAGGAGGQFGARIAFAPDGKSLFLSSGERQRFTPAQDTSQPLGKILHLTLDGKPAVGNPAAGKAGAARVEIADPPRNTGAARSAPARSFAWPGPNLTPAETWASGLRNPYGLAFAPDGRLWEVEMGPKGGDELNLILPGRNYGWPLASNGDNYDGSDIPDHRPGDGFEAPKVWWNPSISPGALLIYRGAMFPQWKGDALIAALSGEALLRVDLDGDAARKAEQWDMGARIRFVGEGNDGAIYLLEDGPGARLLRLTPAQARR